MQKTIFFDLDGTLTPHSTWYELNLLLGITPDEDKMLFEKYLAGGVDYRGWMSALMELYRRGPKLHRDKIVEFAQTLPLRPDAQTVVHAAKEKGYTVLLVSGAVDIVTQTVAQRLGIDTWFAKTAVVYDPDGYVVDLKTSIEGERDGKLHFLESYCNEKGIDPREVYCVGDGGNDLELFKHAKGILLGNNEELKPFAWKEVENLEEIDSII
jgi:HAD superfamily phosphoserine phosphatase-like hydrolase